MIVSAESPQGQSKTFAMIQQYFSMPYEYKADELGGVDRGNYKPWAATTSDTYDTWATIFGYIIDAVTPMT